LRFFERAVQIIGGEAAQLSERDVIIVPLIEQMRGQLRAARPL